MRYGRKVAVALVGIFGVAAIASSALLADTATAFVPPDEPEIQPAKMKLVASSRFGFAPMKVRLSGMMESRDGNLFPLDGGQDVRLVVESPFLHVSTSMSDSSVVSDLHYEAVSACPAQPSPFSRAIELLRPGRYTFRVHVIAPDGDVVSSNEVTVKAL